MRYSPTSNETKLEQPVDETIPEDGGAASLASRTDPADRDRDRIKALSARLDHGARVVVERLGALLDEDPEDDYGVLRPTAYALDTTLALITEASQLQGENFPPASVSTDHRGGCRVRWSRGQRRLHLFVPYTEGEGAYIYHQVADEHSTDSDVSASNLVRWLRWLLGDG